MRIAVTGGLGFIGQKIVQSLIDLGHAVIIVDFWETLIPKYERERVPLVSSVYKTVQLGAGLVDPYTFVDEIKKYGPQVIVHAGAVVNTADLGDGGLWQLNVHYTQQLARNASEAGAHVVFISSAATYGAIGHPNNPYGLSKVLGEQALREVKTRISVLRLFNVFGDSEHHKGDMASVPFKLAECYRKGDIFRMFAPHAARDFVPVSNVVDAVLEQIDVMMGPMRRHWFVQDVGTSEATSFEDLDNFVMQATGNTTSCVRLIDMPAELVGRYQGYTRAGLQGVSVAKSALTTREGIDVYYKR